MTVWQIHFHHELEVYRTIKITSQSAGGDFSTRTPLLESKIRVSVELMIHCTTRLNKIYVQQKAKFNQYQQGHLY
jgi:hypothetical protein